MTPRSCRTRSQPSLPSSALRTPRVVAAAASSRRSSSNRYTGPAKRTTATIAASPNPPHTGKRHDRARIPGHFPDQLCGGSERIPPRRLSSTRLTPSSAAPVISGGGPAIRGELVGGGARRAALDSQSAGDRRTHGRPGDPAEHCHRDDALDHARTTVTCCTLRRCNGEGAMNHGQTMHKRNDSFLGSRRTADDASRRARSSVHHAASSGDHRSRCSRPTS